MEDGEAPPTEMAKARDAILRMSESVPKQVKFRLRNSLQNFERAKRLVANDLEMASFRAITGEEEAASCLIHSIKIRAYEGSEKINPKNHVHKNAIIVTLAAVNMEMFPILSEFQLIFNFINNRIDIRVPLRNFDLESAGNFAIQPIEPLGFIHSKEGIEEGRVFDSALAKLSENSGFENIKKLVDDRANQRNTLLYASDAAMPSSQADLATIELREDRATALLILAIMTLQSKDREPTMRQAVSAVVNVISRLPQDSPL